jgi:hypothetical protein
MQLVSAWDTSSMSDPTPITADEMEHPAVTLALNSAPREELVAAIRELRRERDQYKQIAELNAETIKAMQEYTAESLTDVMLRGNL